MNFRLIIDKTQNETIVVTAHRRSSLTDQIEKLVTQPVQNDRIPAYIDDEVHMLPFTQIECVTVVDGKTYVIDTQNCRYHVKMRLYELEEKLPAHFIRINKSTIANELQLLKFTPSFSGAMDAVFKCGHKEYVSRRCFADIKRRYDL